MFKYNMPDYITAPKDRYDVASNMAHFLMVNDLGIFDAWRGKMKAVDQRKIFGVKLGKGTIVIDGENDRATCRVTVCFGTDSQENVWIECQTGHIGRNFYSPLENTPHEIELKNAQAWF